MSNEKIYVGGAKEMTGNFGEFHKISFSAQDVENLKQNLNAKGYVNLVMNKRREPSHYGQTHSLVIDTWEPQTSSQPQPHPQQQAPQFQHLQPVDQQGHQPAYEAPPASIVPNFGDKDDVDTCPF